MTLKDLEKAIAELPRAEFCRLRDWIASIDADRWDEQLEDDVANGRLDSLANEALSEHLAGRSRPL